MHKGISHIPSNPFEVKRLLSTRKWVEAVQLYEKSPDVSSATTLISYANKSLGNLSLAFGIYNTLKASRKPKPNCYLYTALVYACQRLNGGAFQIVSLWQDMHHYRVEPDSRLYIILLSTCLEMNDINTAASIVAHFEKANLQPDVFLQTVLVKTYCKLGDAQRVFNIWNQMKKTTTADSRFYSNILSFCAESKALELGKDIHQTIKGKGFCGKSERDELMLSSALVNMYSKCGSLVDARAVFNSMRHRDVISWNAMIQAYSIHGQAEAALHLFQDMITAGMVPDDYTYSIILKALAETTNLQEGQRIHELLKRQYVKLSNLPRTVTTSLISFYAKCGELDQARQLFEEYKPHLHSGEVITWTSMIQAYSIHGQFKEALHLFQEMTSIGIVPSEATYLVVLKILAEMTNLNEGNRIHELLKEKYGKFSNYPQTIVTSLIFMYAKCGELGQARRLFEEYDTHPHDNTTWTAMIHAYGLHGEAYKALQLFNAMLQQGIHPDAITFLCLLNACSHAGLVDQAWEIFSTMKKKFGIEPNSSHQSCMVDVWGRAGMLDQAEKFIVSLENQAAILWQTLLSASHNWGDVERAQHATAQILQLNPHDSATYVLMANTYAAAGRWKEQQDMWAHMGNNNIKKTPGITWVTVNGQTEVFYVDSEHLHKQAILAFLSSTRRELANKYSYLPDTSCVLHPELSEEQKLERLWLHSEKLALAWALLNSQHNQGKIIMHKNLRVCRDCHTSLKLISKLYSCKFIIRDANRFHHFENGACSCNDYW